MYLKVERIYLRLGKWDYTIPSRIDYNFCCVYFLRNYKISSYKNVRNTFNYLKILWFSNDPKYKKSHLLIDIYVHVR